MQSSTSLKKQGWYASDVATPTKQLSVHVTYSATDVFAVWCLVGVSRQAVVAAIVGGNTGTTATVSDAAKTGQITILATTIAIILYLHKPFAVGPSSSGK